jgi:hypothetical protein
MVRLIRLLRLTKALEKKSVGEKDMFDVKGARRIKYSKRVKIVEESEACPTRLTLNSSKC